MRLESAAGHIDSSFDSWSETLRYSGVNEWNDGDPATSRLIQIHIHLCLIM